MQSRISQETGIGSRIVGLGTAQKESLHEFVHQRVQNIFILDPTKSLLALQMRRQETNYRILLAQVHGVASSRTD